MQPPGFRPVYSHLVRTDVNGKQVVEAQFAGAQVDIALTSRQGATVYERVQAPSDIRDERTLLLILRALPLAQGYATRINSFLPVVGKMERVAVQVRRTETVTTPARLVRYLGRRAEVQRTHDQGVGGAHRPVPCRQIHRRTFAGHL